MSLQFKNRMLDLTKIPWPTAFVGLDFETYGNVNLPKRGLDNYIRDPDFQALIVSVADGNGERTWDFIESPVFAVQEFRKYVQDTISWNYWFVAHNVGFERAVMEWLGFGDDVLYRITDSAVVSRWMGASSHLEAAAPQLTNTHKLEVGKELIMLFSVPNEENGGKPFTREEIALSKELTIKWQDFKVYCEADAVACRQIVLDYWHAESWKREHEYEWYTFSMNRIGWNVDVELVNEMQLRFEHNSNLLVSAFMTRYAITNDKFLNSTPQMKAWCEERGIKTSSFDAEHLTKLRARLEKQLDTMSSNDPKWEGYVAVLDLITVKQELGGSSLSKLQKILDLVGEDGRLRNQYMHCGAGQSYRSTGKGVQLQNLKRLSSEPVDFDDDDEDAEDPLDSMDNTTMAENLRQVFVADVPGGRQIVGDFASVESRMLAWVCGDDLKVQAFIDGKDMYKVQATLIYPTVPYEDVTKEQRQVGKVGELGCGYGAGPVALVKFAGKMGIEMDEDGALDLVRGWRGTNPNAVDLWDRLHKGLWSAISYNSGERVDLAHGLYVLFTPFDAPPSLQKQHPGIRSMRMTVMHETEGFVLERVFQGTYLRGDEMCFYKASDRKTGDVWVNHYKHPKTGQIMFYKLYGGKITGILVQSICRELFFASVRMLYIITRDVTNVQVIGQFHDEIVASWWPTTPGAGGRYGSKTLDEAQALVGAAMRTLPRAFTGFPLVPEVKNDYRYTK